jgi:methionine biosynthesis protein MetW
VETQSDSDRAISRHEYYDDYWSGAMGRKAEPGMDPDMPGWLNELIWPGTVVLDVGCGDGSRYTDYLISAGAKVHGFDVSDFAVRAARKRGIEAQVANLDRSLPAADEAFDSAVCIEVLEHLVEPEFTAKEIYRMLKPGGSLLVTVPNVGFWGVRMELLLTGHFDPRGCTVTRDRYPWRDPHLRFFNSSSLRNMLLDTGFVIKKQGGLETQFLEFAGLERFFRYKVTRPTQPILRHIGSRFYTVLAQRCVILAQKPVKRTSVHGSHG